MLAEQGGLLLLLFPLQWYLGKRIFLSVLVDLGKRLLSRGCWIYRKAAAKRRFVRRHCMYEVFHWRRCNPSRSRGGFGLV